MAPLSQLPSRCRCHSMPILLVLLLGCSYRSIVLAEAHGGRHGHGPLARCLMLQDLSMVALVMDGQTTAGPFDEDESDYIDDPDMTLAARAGVVADNDVTVDRLSVVEGIPMNLTINVFGVANRTATVAHALPNIEVSIWHCDAAGVYSAAESEGTEGQKWLRGRQVTDTNGTVTFRTILPGLYRGRMAHYHMRLRLPGETSYAITSQLYIADDDVDIYRTVDLYNTDVTTTYSTTDMVYRGVDPAVARMLTLTIDGEMTTAVSSTISLALITDDGLATPTSTTPVMLPPVAPVASPRGVVAPTPSSSTSSSSPLATSPRPKVTLQIMIMMMTTTMLLVGAISLLLL